MGHEPEAAVRRAYDEAVALVIELGHHVEAIAPPRVDGPALGEAFFLTAGAAVSGIADTIRAMRGSPLARSELEPFTWRLVDHFRALGEEALVKARATLKEAARAYLEITRAYDVVLTPTLATEAWRIGHLSPILEREELIARTARAVGYTPIHNIAGCPAMSVPLCFPEGALPIGTHFAAAPGADALLLGLAYQLERARPWADQWPAYSIPRLQ